MKQKMKKSMVVLLALAMTLALSACGAPKVDTKETVQNTVNQLQTQMTSAMSGYQDVFNDPTASNDPVKKAQMIDAAIEMIDAGREACEKVETPGADSQRYKDLCMKMFDLLKNMMTDMKNADLSSTEAALEITKKYLGELMGLSSEALKLGQELVEKYGIVLPTTSSSPIATMAP